LNRAVTTVPPLKSTPRLKGVSAVWMEAMAVERRAHTCEHERDRKANEEPALAEPINVYFVE
jgi:hypothetical protein